MSHLENERPRRHAFICSRRGDAFDDWLTAPGGRTPGRAELNDVRPMTRADLKRTRRCTRIPVHQGQAVNRRAANVRLGMLSADRASCRVLDAAAILQPVPDLPAALARPSPETARAGRVEAD